MQHYDLFIKFLPSFAATYHMLINTLSILRQKSVNPSERVGFKKEAHSSDFSCALERFRRDY